MVDPDVRRAPDHGRVRSRHAAERERRDLQAGLAQRAVGQLDGSRAWRGPPRAGEAGRRRREGRPREEPGRHGQEVATREIGSHLSSLLRLYARASGGPRAPRERMLRSAYRSRARPRADQAGRQDPELIGRDEEDAPARDRERLGRRGRPDVRRHPCAPGGPVAQPRLGAGRLSGQPAPFPLMPAVGKGLTLRGYTMSEVVRHAPTAAEAKKYICDRLADGRFAPEGREDVPPRAGRGRLPLPHVGSADRQGDHHDAVTAGPASSP